MLNSPKYQKHLKETLSQHNNETPTDRYGIVASYDPVTNTAKVLSSAPDSDRLGDIYDRVPCPTTAGIQMAAPEPGRGCWLIFSGRNEGRPMISHFFNHDYQKYDYYRHTIADNGVPNFMVSM